MPKSNTGPIGSICMLMQGMGMIAQANTPPGCVSDGKIIRTEFTDPMTRGVAEYIEGLDDGARMHDDTFPRDFQQQGWKHAFECSMMPFDFGVGFLR